MEAYVLTGGEGTRVKEITDKLGCQKHEILVNGRPFWEYIEAWLLGNPPVSRKGSPVEGIMWLKRPGVGTGGAVKLIEAFPRKVPHFPFLLAYGDIFSPVDVYEMYVWFLLMKADMVMVTREVTEGDYGRVNIGPTSQVSHYRRHHDASFPHKTNVGTYLIGQRVYEFVRNYPWQRAEGVKTLSLESLLSTLLDIFDVYAYDCSELPYYDVGTPEMIAKTEELLKGDPCDKEDQG